MSTINRQELEVRYQIFDRFILKDQKLYYDKAIKRYRTAATQVNRFRAGSAALTAIAAGSAGVLVSSYFTGGQVCGVDAADPASYCDAARFGVGALVLLAMLLPAIGSIFSTLMELYQWDRLSDLYKSASENLVVADAMSPPEGTPDDEFLAYFREYAESALTVMNAETAQWGQSVREAEDLKKFITAQTARAQAYRQDMGGSSSSRS